MNKARLLVLACVTCLLFISNIPASPFAQVDVFLEGENLIARDTEANSSWQVVTAISVKFNNEVLGSFGGYVGKLLPEVTIPTAVLIFCIAILGLIGISRRKKAG